MKKITFTFFALCLCYCPNLWAQKHDYIWLGGGYSKNFKLDFGQFPPRLSRLQLGYYFQLNNIAMSDANGMLDFYSDGCSIRNRLDQTMENGHNFNYDTIYKEYCEKSGYYPLRRGLLALPNAKGYYFFYLSVTRFSNQCSVQDFLMADIDMRPNGGLGKVVWKDSFLLKDVCLQDASATRHANGRDWWILLGSNNAPLYYRFLYQPDIGIQGPWTQRIENPVFDAYYYNGWSLFSPDGTQYASLMNRKGIALYGFDRCTGLLSNMRFTPSTDGSPNTPSLAFSANGRYLYQTWQQGETVVQYDTWANPMDQSRTVISIPIKWLYQAMNMGPDGKIYIWCSSFSDSCASVIHFPNRKGAACRLVERAQPMPERVGGFSLYYPNYRLGPIDGSSCDTLGLDNRPKALWRHDPEDNAQPLRVTFTDLSYYAPSAWYWDFGDGNSSRDTSPVHTYAQAGTYRVCLVVQNPYASDTLCKTIAVGLSPTWETPAFEASEVRLVPNPADAFTALYMENPPLGEEVGFVLSNVLGRVCVEGRLSGQTTRFETAHLPPGLYFARAVCKGKTLFVKPLVIQR